MNKWMRTCMAVAFCALLVTGVSGGNAQAAAEGQTAPTLSVDGTGKGEVAPDRAIISIGITSTARDAKEAQAANAQKAAAIQRALIANGVSEKNIQTENYSFSPVYREDRNGYQSNEITGYRVDNTVTATVDAIQSTGAVIDAALAAGANNISSLDFSAKSLAPAEHKALDAAVKDARRKADVIANALGRRIVGIQEVTTGGGHMPKNFVGARMMMAEDAAAPTPIAPGTLQVTANVHIVYLLSE